MSSPAFQIRSGRIRAVAPSALRARLTVVPRLRTHTSPLPFVTLVSFVLLAGVIGLLMFNTSMQQAAFTATTMEQQAATLSAREETLRMELDVLRDPQRVALKAQGMGMVVPATPAFLRLADGKVLGTPAAATREDGLRLLPKPPAKPAVLDPPPHVVIVKAKARSNTESGVARGDGGAATGKNKGQGDQSGNPGSGDR
jgi:hypothetical protein